ncbi:MAG TPA: VanZ family protein [Gammaproteobacteria bacterium]|nr:VanZ family protein [Gammaproteobacteria bacterium]
MLSLRFPKLWSALGWLLVAGVIVGSLIPGPSVPAVDIDDKVMHAAAYLLLMVWFAGCYRRDRYLTIGAALAALGIGLDTLQVLTATRSFDWGDVAMNCAGVVAGLALSWSLLGGWCQRVEQRLLS